ncbi:MAG: D-alanine--D-alanine ligase [Candidatus Vogelbacteria bacterium CG10_big_fil_rev_8_21_14_0_10_49_38]|uniref:D-alanine--D-alanine ligase n=1 Tax=Candidatus Vogelbacteria bacterium CG10_big_fil_rev_8_21_14_0_10_49_38 TaxID=1975043 RepID=A0A2H0RIF9_9BACT|nr:MAG: hypothetical protein BK006_01085 [bacterium CG10_49_38]PIR46196.1 MAG: D-alanine--D-alanine ligase [Candidatus Vogelbacteria bacterium CG10_big_fil_rev_8_21_14_0_10_49_38]
MAPIRVGILRGGIGSEYEVSLRTGAGVLRHLPGDKYQPVDILLSRDGAWYAGGLRATPERAVRGVDVIFNALHGEFGEDGQAQQLLDYLFKPYTGSGAVASALGMDKPRAKELFRQAGLRVPNGAVLRRADRPEETDAEAVAYDVFKKIPPPWIVKPASGGSSVDLRLARHYPELVAAVAAGLKQNDRILVEEYVRGQEATVGVVDRLRGRDHYPLLPVEIVTLPDKVLFDYEAKYGGQTKEICPGRFRPEDKLELERQAVLIHQQLGLRHYSRSDFIISPRGIYVLEVNTLPGLTEESLVPKALAAAGIAYPQFLDHLVTLALERR